VFAQLDANHFLLEYDTPRGRFRAVAIGAQKQGNCSGS